MYVYFLLSHLNHLHFTFLQIININFWKNVAAQEASCNTSTVKWTIPFPMASFHAWLLGFHQEINWIETLFPNLISCKSFLCRFQPAPMFLSRVREFSMSLLFHLFLVAVLQDKLLWIHPRPKFLFTTWNDCHGANKSHVYLVTESKNIQQVIVNVVQLHIFKPSWSNRFKPPQCFCV